jgi:serine/threonine protein kinase
MDKELINEFKKFGIIIDNLFLKNIIERNFYYIKSKINDLGKINHLIKNNKNYITYLKNDVSFTYKIIGFICKGSYNQAYLITDENKTNYVYRCPLNENTKTDNIISNFIEIFIHLLLNIISPYLHKKNMIMKLKAIGYNSNQNFICSIVDKMDGTLYGFLKDNTINNDNKQKILKKVILEIAELIKELQENFKFMHNDLKCDNIFYKINRNNYLFYLGDFDNSRIEINNKIILNKNFFILDDKFNSKKDLFIFINSIAFSFKDEIWAKDILGLFPIEKTLGSQEKFHTLYSYQENYIDNIYEPSQFIKKLINN